MRKRWNTLAHCAAVGFSICSLCPVPSQAERPPASGGSPVADPALHATKERVASYKSEDARLAGLVTFPAAPQLYLGEMLEMLSERSGVSLSVSDEGGASGEEIMASLTDVPLADVMDALQSLFSHQGAEWYWTREGEPGAYRYRLLRPATVDAFAGRMAEQIQREFEAEADLFLAGLEMSPEELEAATRRNDRIGYLNRSPRGRAGLLAFRDCLTPEMRGKVLRGEARPEFVVSALTQSGTAFVEYLVNETRSLPGRTDIPWPLTIKFDADLVGNKLTPSLFIHVGEMGAYSYLGGTPVETAKRKEIEGLWLSPGGHYFDADEEGRSVPAPKGEPKLDRSEHRTGQRLLQVATSPRFTEAGISLLANLPRPASSASSFDPGAPWKAATLGAFLERLRDGSMARKWRQVGEDENKKLLLVGNLNWFRNDLNPETKKIPWGVVRQLRKHRDANAGVVPLAGMAAVAALNEGQIERLRRGEFPEMSEPGYGSALPYLLRAVRHHPALFRRLCSEGGLPLRLLSEEPKKTLRQIAPQLASEPGIVPNAVRLSALPAKISDGKPTAGMRLEVLSQRGKLLHTAEYTWQGRAVGAPASSSAARR